MGACRWSVGSPLNDVARIVLILTLAAALPGAAAARNELRDRMLCPAELLVVQADARTYYRTPPDDPLSRGLRHRISAALATLPLTCRRYAAAVSMPPESGRRFVSRIRGLRELFDSGGHDRFPARLDELTAEAPFDVTYFLIDREGARDEREAGGTYRRYCHGCHSAPVSGAENPALSLHDMARGLPREEFFARMLLGVRGTPEIGLSNPLTTLEIGAMTRFLETGPTPGSPGGEPAVSAGRLHPASPRANAAHTRTPDNHR